MYVTLGFLKITRRADNGIVASLTTIASTGKATTGTTIVTTTI
jgi:hypothetical protein